MKQIRFWQFRDLVISRSSEFEIEPESVAAWVSEETLSALIGIMVADQKQSIEAVVAGLIASRHV